MAVHRSPAVSHGKTLCPAVLAQHGRLVHRRGTVRLQNGQPASLDFLIGYGQRFQPMITIGEYTKLFVTITLGLGLIFEMPILVFFLALMRVITARWMWRNLRYSILVIFVVAAIVTPTSDILNMCLFAAPMVALYAISMGVALLGSSPPKNGAGAALPRP